MDCSGEEKAPSRQLSRSELLKRAGALGAAAAVPVALAPEARSRKQSSPSSGR